MPIDLLLVKDVEDLGRSGDIVKVKPGYARNYLLPRGFGVAADANAKRMQERLQVERKKKAEEDRKESETVAKKIEGMTLTQVVKVDPEGHMYGSVSVIDLISLLKEQTNIEFEKREVVLKNPIKNIGVHTIPLKFKEGVTASFTLKVVPEGVSLEEETQEVEEKADEEEELGS